MRLLDMSKPEALEWADKRVQEAFTTWQMMVYFDWPDHQIRLVEAELEGRIIEAERIKRIHERLSKRGHTKKHR